MNFFVILFPRQPSPLSSNRFIEKFICSERSTVLSHRPSESPKLELIRTEPLLHVLELGIRNFHSGNHRRDRSTLPPMRMGCMGLSRFRHWQQSRGMTASVVFLLGSSRSYHALVRSEMLLRGGLSTHPSPEHSASFHSAVE